MCISNYNFRNLQIPKDRKMKIMYISTSSQFQVFFYANLICIIFIVFLVIYEVTKNGVVKCR